MNNSTATVANQAHARIVRRILPYVFLVYAIHTLDKTNVAFAKLRMSVDLGFSEAVYGFGAGVFFLGYLLLEIPGGLAVERWGARRIVSSILVIWGFCTISLGFVRTSLQFYTARFLLGLAESGFYPGIIVYLSHWFPHTVRARATAALIIAFPVAMILGGPLAGVLLAVDWFQLEGWRWIFILEGLPAILLGLASALYLTNRPREAKWLQPAECEWIEGELELEKEHKIATAHMSVLRTFCEPNVLFLASALFCYTLSGSAFFLWLPTMVQQLSGFSEVLSSAFSGLPHVTGLMAMLWVSRSSDRSGERKLHVLIPWVLYSGFFALSTIPGQPFWLATLWLCLTGAAIYAWAPSFWVLPTLVLGESAAAVSIGIIAAVGSLAGFLGPWWVGYLLSRGFSFSIVIPFLSIFPLAAVGLVALVRIPAGLNYRG